MGSQKGVDILIVGAGVLGVTLAYWLSSLYDCRILLIDQGMGIAPHTSSRNTGVIHRPFYLDPRAKRVFARTSEASYPLWRDLAKEFGLWWNQVGTLEAAVNEAQVSTLEEYSRWGHENGIAESELQLLDKASARALEPEVDCKAALFSKADVSVDFGQLTRLVFRLASANGVNFLGGQEVMSARRDKDGGVEVGLRSKKGPWLVRCRVLLNAAGAGALRIAHMLGSAREYSAMYFRGEYWFVDEPFASRVGRNVYTPPKYPEFPFLDPHFVVRYDGRRQIGPNAVLVAGPYSYQGPGFASFGTALEAPNAPKLNLLRSRTFLAMVGKEWRSSLSKRAMCSRVKEFIPALRPEALRSRGVSGIRGSVIGEGGFVPEALLFHDRRVLHVVNYNSPGATGAPAYSAMLVAELRKEGSLEGFRTKAAGSHSRWDFDRALAAL
ncbi:MAG: FAD-dependent oxidoreductase [Thaumarchaeota archaeon]|nr:FAD-dependent oxidoreductase [Nitrososphaerota archaeon]